MVPHLPLPPKTSLREAQKNKRLALSVAEHVASSAECCERLCRVIEHLVSEPLCIAGYAPIKSELDIMPALCTLSAQHTICLPVTESQSKILSFRQFAPGDALAPGKYAIGEPAADAKTLIPDIIIVPLLGFDREGNRLGYGAGYYDATIKALRSTKPLVTIGAGFSFQHVEALPTEPHDEKLDIIVTEQEIILLSF